MKNILRVTAIILTMVTVIVTHPFLSLEAKVINNGFERINQSTVTIDVANNTGNSSFDNSVQLISNYSVSDPSMTTGFSISVTVEQEVPLIYVCDVVLNFRHTVDYAFLRLTFTKPSSGSFPLSFIGENIRVQGMGNSSSTSYMDLYVYETNSVHLQILFSFGQLRDYYGYALPLANNVTEVPWVMSGTTYFKVETARMNNCALDTEIDYTQYIDGIENQLTTIGNRLNNINTNIDGVEGLLSNLVTEADEIEALLTAINNSVNGLKTLSLYNVPEYSWGIYNVFNRSYSLKTDNLYTKPYYHVTVNSSSSFNYLNQYFVTTDDDDMYYIVYSDSINNVNPFKIIKGDNTDITSQINLSWITTSNKRIYIAKFPHTLSGITFNVLFNYEMNIQPVYFGQYKYMPIEVAQLIRIDANDTYVRELQKIAEAVNNITVTNNTTVNDINTNITEYNTTIQNVFNIENNLSSSLDQSMQQFTPDNTNILQRLNDSSTLLKSVVNQINGIDIFTIPLSVALVGIVLIAIVG